MSVIDLDALWTTIEDKNAGEFLILPDARIAYADLGMAVRRWLGWFDASGIAPGERLVIRTGNEVAAISAFVAALLDGVIPVMVTPDTPNARVEAIIAVTEPRGFVGDSAVVAPALTATTAQLAIGSVDPAAAAPRGWLRRRAETDRLPGLPEAASRPPRLPRDADDIAYILFTSGTTASPSGVQITRANLFANLRTLIRVFAYDGQSRIFNDMILAHADGMIQGPVLALAAGCAVVRSGGFQLATMETWLGRIRRERATHVIAVPTVWAMIDLYAAHDDYFDAPECVGLQSVAAKLSEELWTRLGQRFSRPVFNQYGLTETAVTALWAGPQREMGAFGSIGRPIDCEAMVHAPDAGGQGELLLRGANIFPGYWRDEARTAASFTDDGWFRTGDLVRQRPDRSYDMLGRLKTVIMMGGFLIRPDEIDEAMLRHDAVCESATIAMDDATFGEVPVTVVVLRQEADEAALTAHARNHLESQKVPKRIVAVPAIPRGVSGKAQVSALRAAILAAIGDASTRQSAGTSVEEDVMAVAAEVFRVPVTALAPGSKAGSVAGWDSFSQLNFLLAVEERFGIRIPASRVAAIASIGDMVRVVGDQRK